MPTLDELIAEHTKDGKRPDDIRVRQSDWRPEAWFRPYFKSQYGCWYGLNQDGTQRSFTPVEEDFELYTEPKPKVKRAQYLLAYPGVNPFITDQLYIDEKQVRDQMAKNLIICERLIETERDFDE